MILVVTSTNLKPEAKNKNISDLNYKTDLAVSEELTKVDNIMYVHNDYSVRYLKVKSTKAFKFLNRFKEIFKPE